MLIWRFVDWRVESDGYVSGSDVARLADLLALRNTQLQLAARDTSFLAERARNAKRRALVRGYRAGRAAALHDLIMPAAAAAFALSQLDERILRIAADAITDIIGKLPPDATLPNLLRRGLEAASEQRLLSVRVSTCDHEDARRALDLIEQELGLPLVKVLADADLPPRSCVVETDCGVIDGSLRLHLAALERGMRDAIRALLDEYKRIDDTLLRQLDVIEQGLRDTLDVLSRETAHRPTPGGRAA